MALSTRCTKCLSFEMLVEEKKTWNEVITSKITVYSGAEFFGINR